MPSASVVGNGFRRSGSHSLFDLINDDSIVVWVPTPRKHNKQPGDMNTPSTSASTPKTTATGATTGQSSPTISELDPYDNNNCCTLRLGVPSKARTVSEAIEILLSASRDIRLNRDV